VDGTNPIPLQVVPLTQGPPTVKLIGAKQKGLAAGVHG